VQLYTLWVSGQPYDLEALMDDRVFIGSLRPNLFICGYMVRIHGTTEKRILTLMGLIERELEERR
jgi:hypothetical protein